LKRACGNAKVTLPVCDDERVWAGMSISHSRKEHDLFKRKWDADFVAALKETGPIKPVIRYGTYMMLYYACVEIPVYGNAILLVFL
jgi:hypothetical protein